MAVMMTEAAAPTTAAKKRKRATLEKTTNITAFFQKQSSIENGELNVNDPPPRRGSAADAVPSAFWSANSSGWSAVAALNKSPAKKQEEPIAIDDSSADDLDDVTQSSWQQNPIINQYKSEKLVERFVCPICSRSFPMQHEIVTYFSLFVLHSAVD